MTMRKSWQGLLVCAVAVSFFAVGCKKADESGAENKTANTTADSPKEASKAPTAPPDEPGKPDNKLDEQTRAELEAKAAKAIPTVDDGRHKKADSEAKADPNAKPDSNSATAGFSKTLADTATYQLKLHVPAAKVGEKSSAKLNLVPKKGWKLNLEFPTKLSLTAPAGVTLAKATQKVGDAVVFDVKKGATWAVDFTPSEAGEANFSGKIKFAVCTDATCDPKKELLAFAVSVKP